MLRASEIKTNWFWRQAIMSRNSSKIWFANYSRSKEIELDRFRSLSRLCNFPESEIIDTRSLICLEALVSWGCQNGLPYEQMRSLCYLACEKGETCYILVFWSATDNYFFLCYNFHAGSLSQANILYFPLLCSYFTNLITFHKPRSSQFVCKI